MRLEAYLRGSSRRGRQQEYDPEHGVATCLALSLPSLSEESFRQLESKGALPATTPANKRHRRQERSAAEMPSIRRFEGKCQTRKPLRRRRNWWVLRRASDSGCS